MNKQQQELYEKLLKKVNEYCLGAGAEDVIAAIDALVETYEHPKKRTSKTKDQLLVELESYEIMLHKVRGYVESKEFTLEDLAKKFKALEIIKNKKVNVRAFLKSCYHKDSDTQLKVYNSQCCDWKEMESKDLTPEEYELLKEVLK